MGIASKIAKLPLLAQKGFNYIFNDKEGLYTEVEVSERVYEYGFVARELLAGKGEGRPKVLDVGYAFYQNVLMSMIPEMGFEYFGMDRQGFPFAYRNFHHVTSDAKKAFPFKDNEFDFVLSVSAIEHFGLGGMYGEDEDPQGDSKAVAEMARVAKKGARIIATLPYNGKCSKVFRPAMRVYDEAKIREMFDAGPLKLDKIEIRLLKGRTYQEIELEESRQYDFPYAGKATMLALVVSRKV